MYDQKNAVAVGTSDYPDSQTWPHLGDGQSHLLDEFPHCVVAAGFDR
jgi:hypothetical protein